MNTLVASAEAPKPYEPIITGLAERDITDTMDAFLAFLELPEEEKEKVQYFDETRPRTGWSGYAHDRADPDIGEYDNKHKFHMTQALAEAFRLTQWTRGFPSETRRFLALAEDLHLALAEAGKAKYQALEEDIPGITALHFPRSGQLATHTRFLAYEPGRSTLAEAHYDKSTGTIAVAESHDGLRIGTGNEDLRLIERDQFQPLFFPGFGYHQLAEIMDRDVSRRAGWHDVIDTQKRVTDTIARWAIVNFINPAHLYLDSTPEQTHTPIPWRGMGKLALRSDNASFLPHAAAA